MQLDVEASPPACWMDFNEPIVHTHRWAQKICKNPFLGLEKNQYQGQRSNGLAVRAHTDGQTDGRTDGRYQFYYLPRFAVDNNSIHFESQAWILKVSPSEDND